MQQGSSKLRSYGQWLDCSNFKWNFNKNLFSSIHFFKKLAPNVGLEPTTLRLRVSCSTDWASRACCCSLAVSYAMSTIALLKKDILAPASRIQCGTKMTSVETGDRAKRFDFSQSVGFEPTLPEGNWFLVSRLNHSATTAVVNIDDEFAM